MLSAQTAKLVSIHFNFFTINVYKNSTYLPRIPLFFPSPFFFFASLENWCFSCGHCLSPFSHGTDRNFSWKYQRKCRPLESPGAARANNVNFNLYPFFSSQKKKNEIIFFLSLYFYFFQFSTTNWLFMF